MINIYKNGIETAVTPNSTTAIIEQMDVMTDVLQAKLTAIEDKVDKDIRLGGMDLSKYHYQSMLNSRDTTRGSTVTLLDVPNFSGYVYAMYIMVNIYGSSGYNAQARCQFSIGSTDIIKSESGPASSTVYASGSFAVGDIEVGSRDATFSLPISSTSSDPPTIYIPRPIRVDNQRLLVTVYGSNNQSSVPNYKLSYAYLED